jgi:hypothetical protein
LLRLFSNSTGGSTYPPTSEDSRRMLGSQREAVNKEANELLARRGYGLELDPHYVDAAVRRWQAYTRRDADGKVAVMEHHASAGWPTAIMAQGFMAKGLHGMPYDPFAIAGADHWHSVGVQRVRALSNDVANSAFRPGWLALGRARLDQLGGRELP